MSIRETAKIHLEIAEKLHLEGSSHNQRLAAFSARLALECITFGIFSKLREKMDLETTRKWQPSKLVREIAEIFPESTQSATISFSDQSSELPSIDLEVWSLSPKQINKFWHKLGSLLHPKGLSVDAASLEFHSVDEIEKALKEILPLIRKHLESQSYGLLMQLNCLRIECQCGHGFLRETNSTSKENPRHTKCPSCGLQYSLSPGEVRQVTKNFQCPNNGCGHDITINSHLFEVGGSQNCKKCEQTFWIKHDVTLVSDSDAFASGPCIVTYVSKEE